MSIPIKMKFPSFESLKYFAERFAEVDLSAMEPFIATMRVAARLMAETETYLQSRNLSHGRFMTLLILMRSQGRSTTPGDLATEMNVTPARGVRCVG